MCVCVLACRRASFDLHLQLRLFPHLALLHLRAPHSSQTSSPSSLTVSRLLFLGVAIFLRTQRKLVCKSVALGLCSNCAICNRDRSIRSMVSSTSTTNPTSSATASGTFSSSKSRGSGCATKYKQTPPEHTQTPHHHHLDDTPPPTEQTTQ
jgi:hypothetical protein